MCVGKALTGGYLTMAAALCTPEVARGISDGEAGVLMHGPTFMGNPLAAAVALASVRLLLARDWRAEVARDRGGAAGRAGAAAGPAGGGRRAGARGDRGGAARPPGGRARRRPAAAVAAGVWLRPFRDLVYTMPPYVCTADDLAAITAAVCAAAAAG